MIAGLGQDLYAFILLLAQTVFIIVAGRIVERRNPVERDQSRSELRLDYQMVFVNLFLNGLLARYVGALGALVIGAAGGGLIALPAHGWGLAVSAIVAVLTMEFVSYWWHRAQHAVPFLWSMHTLHHSAEALTITTGARHFWFENIFPMGIIPVVAIIIKIPPQLINILPLIYLLETFSHLNARIAMGRFSLWVVSPQFHRIHHSAEPQHADRNFCKLLPIMDVLFGTAWIPQESEFPKTGLTSGAKPAGIWDGIVWPLRRLGGFREARALAAQGAVSVRT